MYICHKRFFAVNKVRLIYPRGVLQTRLIWQIEWIGSTEDISDKGIKIYENQCKSKVKYKIKRRRRESETSSGRKTKKSQKLFRFNFNPKSKGNIYLARKLKKVPKKFTSSQTRVRKLGLYLQLISASDLVQK